jgi:hypothetical protein
MKARIFLLLCLLVLVAPFASAKEKDKPARAIIFIIDGMHWQAPEKIGIDNFNALRLQGTYIQKCCLLMPYHPLGGDWGKIHNSSLPNPVMLAGSLAITPGHKMIQEMFPGGQITAHSTNSGAYVTVGRGCEISHIRNTQDEKAIDFAIEAFKKYPIKYMRIHLQDTGTGGWNCSTQKDDVPWKHNIWGDGSPYVKNFLNADELLGRFVNELKKIGKWDNTLLIVTADHGQAVTGWHPTLEKDSWYVPLLFVGPGVAKGRQFTYAEQIDIIPTICDFMNLSKPVEKFSGKALNIIKEDTDPQTCPPDKKYTQKINNQLLRYAKLKSEMILAAGDDPYLENVVLISDRKFYHLDRFTEWTRAGSTLQDLINANQRLLDNMSQELTASKASDAVSYGQGTFALPTEPGQIAFENPHIAFRAYSSDFALDVFGKTAKGRKLTLKNFYKLEEPAVQNYHSLSDIGMDILHVGKTPGLGGVGVVYKNKLLKPQAKLAQNGWKIITYDPANCVVKIAAPIEINNKAITVQRTLKLDNSSRFLKDKVELFGDEKILKHSKIAVGVRTFQENKSEINKKQGYIATWGRDNESQNVCDVEWIALAVKFDPEIMVATVNRDGGIYAVLQPELKDGSAIVNTKLTAGWHADHTLNNLESLKEMLRREN